MKKLAEFKSGTWTAAKNEETEPLEVSDLPDFVTEGEQNHHAAMDPPAVLIMRRKTVRVFPDNQRVAMYYIDKINKYVTIPYKGLEWASPKGKSLIQVGESLDEDIIHHMNDVAQNGYKSVKFKDGSSTKVDTTTAHMMLKVHGALNDENKKKFSDYAHKSKHHFSKMVDFGWKQVK